ncbi:ubiquitin thiolesterase, partial [Aureobasidium melanogenum]
TRKQKHRDEPPQKMSKLAINAETEEDRFDTVSTVKCFECGNNHLDKSQGNLAAVVDGVLKANTFAKQEEVKAWEQEMVPCEHTLCLEQEAARQIHSQALGHCSQCDLNQNLWLCLTCGNLGCGRAQFGGVGGNSHGVAHTDSTGHPVAVKLGSLTADGNADIYCYACNEERTDPELVAHLAHWGIDIAGREKTEKSLTEMQLEQNLRWEFSMTNEDGKELKPMCGPGLTGLKNLGNSCYLASVVQ